jgi:hypothetical protein
VTAARRRAHAATWLVVVSLTGLVNVKALAQGDDVVLRAMRDELNRSRGLKVLSLEAPYFIEYSMEDGDSFGVAASLGGLVAVRHDRFRVPEIKVRVGDYKFDNTDYVGSGYHFGTHYAFRSRIRTTCSGAFSGWPPTAHTSPPWRLFRASGRR